MKLLKLKEKLEKKQIKKRTLKAEFRSVNKKINNNIKIIGITGSRGKSTTAIIIHNYLKYLGYKSVLYSSATVDSPASI